MLPFIKDKLQGYVGSLHDVPGAAVISELIQNADDAGASRVGFRFYPDLLEVTNDSFFTPKDFSGITEMLAGHKEDEPNKIGAFGTGFISVYHLTDEPHLHSGRRHLIFYPKRDKYETLRSDIDKATVFRFPWRKQQSEIGEAIRATVWSDAEIAALKAGLERIIYRLVLFLRHVRTIEVLDGDGTLLYRVRRRLRKSAQPQGRAFVRERWKVVFESSARGHWSDTWLYYSSDVADDAVTDGVTAKDRRVTIAFPLESRDWLTAHVPGILYNFLPTAIRTGYAYQVNGAFFPDNNRRGILLDASTQPAKTGWNQGVLRALGALFASAAIDIRQQVREPRRFYELLPLAAPADEDLAALRDGFAAAAPSLPIIHSTLRSWSLPGGVKVGGAIELRRLAARYLPILPENAPETLHRFLDGSIRSRPLTLGDVFAHLAPLLHARVSLEQAPAMIASREQLETLYLAIEQEWGRTSPASRGDQDESLRRWLYQLPIYLAEDGRLYGRDDVWRGDGAARALMLEGVARFVAPELQQRFGAFLTAVLKELRGPQLLDCLHDTLGDTTRLPLPLGPSLLNSRERLRQVLHFLHRDHEALSHELLATLPLVLDADQVLRRADDGVYLWVEGHDYELLRSLGLRFVDRSILDAGTVVEFYRRATVPAIHARAVLAHLAGMLRDDVSWSDAPFPLDTAGGLGRLYEYFFSHRDSLDRDLLRSLPLYPTQNRRLTSSRVPDDGLFLPMAGGGSAGAAAIALLRLDCIIHKDALAGVGHSFLAEVIGLETLAPPILVRRYLLERYQVLHLDHAERLQLLRFVREVWDEAEETGRAALKPALLVTPLVRCDDDRYRPGSAVYLPTAELDVVLAQGYARLHGDYSDDWAPFFDALGVRRLATPEDLLKSIETVVGSGPPSEERRARIAASYRVLQREIGREYAPDDPALRRLAEIAWLPAKQEPGRWFRPADLYPASCASLLGDTRPLLALADPSARFRALMGMPGEPVVELVAGHLRASRAAGKRVEGCVYAFLAANASAQQLASLGEEAIIWDKRSAAYWHHGRIIVGDYDPRFGTRRGYVDPDDGDALTLLGKLGRTPRQDWEESLRLLEELAHEYAGAGALPPGERELLIANFDHLGRQEHAFAVIGREHRERFRALPIYPTQGNRLAPIDTPGAVLKLPAAASHTGRVIPFDTLRLDTLIHSDLLGTRVRRFLTGVLGVEELDSFGAVRDYVLPRYHDDQAAHTDDERLALLRFIADVWEELPDRQKESLLPQLRAVRLIRCGDHGSPYRVAADVYLRSDELDTILASGYPHPHESYPTRFLPFFEELGARRYPSTADLVATIEQVVRAGPPTAERFASVERIYALLNEQLGDGKRYQPDDHLARLALIPWLPVRPSGPFGHSWHIPGVVYQGERAALIGNQAPILGLSEATREPLRALLKMPSLPPVELVVAHLFASMGADPPRQVSGDVYRYLGSHWEAIAPDHRARLRNEAVFWAAGRFWAGRHIFFDDYRELFGARRLYAPGGSSTALRPFLDHIGARVAPNPWTDHIDLLTEIGRAHGDGRIATRDDQRLLLRNFDHLGRQGRALTEDTPAPHLQALPVVPAHDGRLYPPHAVVLVDQVQRAKLGCFEPGVIPFIDQEGIAGIPLTEHAHRFLRRVLHLSPLSAFFKRELAGRPAGSREDAIIGRRLRGLSGAFRRIDKTIREQRGDLVGVEHAFDQLERIRFFTCSELLVDYVLDNGRGWRVVGERAAESVLYVAEQAAIYVQTDPSIDGRPARVKPRPLARELENLLFPGSKESVVIERLLNMAPEQAERYLDSHNYLSLFAERISHQGDDSADDGEEWMDAEAADNISDDARAASQEEEPGHKPAEAAPPAGTTGSPRKARPAQAAPAAPPAFPARAERGDTSRRAMLPAQPLLPRYVPWQPECTPEEATLQGAAYGAPIRTRPGATTSRGEQQSAGEPEAHPERISQQEKEAIGRWGEHYVVRYLGSELTVRYPGGIAERSATGYIIRQHGRRIAEVTWLNSDRDHPGYDIQVVEGNITHQIEVKATKTEAKAEIDLSGAQWECARSHNGSTCLYHIYRVYNAGTRAARLVVITDPARLWQDEAIAIAGIRFRV